MFQKTNCEMIALKPKMCNKLVSSFKASYIMAVADRVLTCH